jgi:hypothetical protein
MRSPWRLIQSASAVICFLFGLLAIQGTTANAQSGLLLGLNGACDDKSCDPPNRTLWIAPQNGKLQILELPDLIVPRRTGFWRAGTRFYCDPDELKSDPHREPSPQGALFATPVNQRPTVYGVARCPTHVHYQNTEGACGDDVPYGAMGVNITFVSGEYISLDYWGRTDCGAHPDGSMQSRVERLGDPFRNPIAYGEIEGDLASGEYEWRAADALIENASSFNDDGQRTPLGEGGSDDDKQIRENFPKWSTMTNMDKVTVMQTLNRGCFPEHDDREWHIVRNHGQWGAFGSFDTHRFCGGHVYFELPLRAAFTASATVPIALDALNERIRSKDIPAPKAIKGVIDALWSPNHDLLAVFVNPDKACISDSNQVCIERKLEPKFSDQTLLQIYLPRGDDLGQPVISLKLKAYERPVMTEWALGSNVPRWTAELRRIKAQGVVKPLLSSSPRP